MRLIISPRAEDAVHQQTVYTSIFWVGESACGVPPRRQPLVNLSKGLNSVNGAWLGVATFTLCVRGAATPSLCERAQEYLYYPDCLRRLQAGNVQSS